VSVSAASKIIKNVLLCYPPIGMFQRGEERCQADTESSATQMPHAPNDLGYIASNLEAIGIKPVIRDYPIEGASQSYVYDEIRSLNPDAILISTTTPTFPEDIAFLRKVKEILPGIITIAKGSCFYAFSPAELKKSAYGSLDIAVYGEAEFIVNDIIRSFNGGAPLEDVKGLILNIGTDKAERTAAPDFREDLDALPFPKRSLIKNERYKNPVTGRPMATVIVSRGCPARCVFCLTPLISGGKLRKRSVDNVIGELKDCVNNYGIRDFFFRADTFTIDKGYVKRLCEEIRANRLDIAWVANSRTDTVDGELLGMMKDAGCWLMAFGIESGNEEIQKKIKKGATSDEARGSVALCRKAGIKTLGFFMIGFPWEAEDTLLDTYDLMKELDCDFIEVHIAMPFEGTELNTICKELGLIKDLPIGYNYFSNPYSQGTLHISKDRLIEFRKKMIRDHYLRLSYIYRTLRNCRSLKECFNYFRYGIRLVANIYG